MSSVIRSAFLFSQLGLSVALSGLLGCSSSVPPGLGGDEAGGMVGLELQLGPGVSLSTIHWTIHNPALLAADRSGSVDVSNSQAIEFVVGGLPAGTGYEITLTATTDGPGGTACIGTAGFDIVAGSVTPVGLDLACGGGPADGGSGGSVVIKGSVTIAPSCAVVTFLSASPSQANIGGTIALSAGGIDDNGSRAAVSFSWVVTGGTGTGSFSDPTSPAPTFTCTGAGSVNVTVTAATSVASCASNTASVTLTCVSQTAVAISSGAEHSCAVFSSGTVACWGRNDAGQLGNATTTTSSSPVAVSGLTGVVAVAAGGLHTCALLSDGTVACWGSEDEIGSGTATGPDDCGFPCSMTPAIVPGLSGVTAIASGSPHTCALLSDGTVACWGKNLSGELGDGTQTNRLSPVAVQGLHGVTAIAAGDTHTCALLPSGTVACWGYNFSGQLGNGTTGPNRCGSDPCSVTPVAVVGLTGATAIAAGGNHTCALRADGTVACWGLNDVGELGNGGMFNSSTPANVLTLSSAISVTAGFYHTCAVLADGSVQCWGDNSAGELCNGMTTNATTSAPVPASTLSGAQSLSAGVNYTCALVSGGAVECCGFNARGQLGNGKIGNSSKPVNVLF
jgi:alpha-tubulin suppressor-like RCC1 family protein